MIFVIKLVQKLEVKIFKLQNETEVPRLRPYNIDFRNYHYKKVYGFNYNTLIYPGPGRL